MGPPLAALRGHAGAARDHQVPHINSTATATEGAPQPAGVSCAGPLSGFTSGSLTPASFVGPLLFTFVAGAPSVVGEPMPSAFGPAPSGVASSPIFALQAISEFAAAIAIAAAKK